MALFSFPKVRERTFNFSPEMLLSVDHYEDSKGNLFLEVDKPEEFRFVRGVLNACDVKKFSEFPELLQAELDEEERSPDISSLEKDIFAAVYDNDFVKFMRCVSRVGYSDSLLPRIFSWLMSKEKFTKRDLSLLKRVEGASSVYNIFDY